MKVSEIQASDITNYLRLEAGEYNSSEIDMMLVAAKAFIHSYTGIKDKTIAEEEVGIGDGESIIFSLSNSGIVSNSINVYVDGVLKTKNIDYVLDFATGMITFVTAPNKGAVITADYQSGIDAFEEFPIVVYILCQDMYDNRSLYVDKNNLNKVVDTILGMHCVNLL